MVFILLWCKTCTWNTTITICLIWIYSIYKVNVLVRSSSVELILMDVKQKHFSGNYVQEFNLSMSDWEVLSEGWDWEKAAVPLMSSHSGGGVHCPVLRSMDNAEEAHYPAWDIHLAVMPLQRSFKLWFAEGKRSCAKLSPKIWRIWSVTDLRFSSTTANTHNSALITSRPWGLDVASTKRWKNDERFFPYCSTPGVGLTWHLICWITVSGSYKLQSSFSRDSLRKMLFIKTL